MAVREMVLMNASAALYVAGKVPLGFGFKAFRSPIELEVSHPDLPEGIRK